MEGEREKGSIRGRQPVRYRVYEGEVLKEDH